MLTFLFRGGIYRNGPSSSTNVSTQTSQSSSTSRPARNSVNHSHIIVPIAPPSVSTPSSNSNSNTGIPYDPSGLLLSANRASQFSESVALGARDEVADVAVRTVGDPVMSTAVRTDEGGWSWFERTHRIAQRERIASEGEGGGEGERRVRRRVIDEVGR